MSENKRTFLLYAIFGIGCFFLFLLLSFPWETLLPRITQWVEPQLSRDGSVHLEAANLSPYGLTGVTLRDVKVRDAEKILFEAKKVSVRLRILPLLLKTYSLGISAKAYGGSISGHLGRKTDRFFGPIRPQSDFVGKIHVADLKLAQVGPLTAWVPLSGAAHAKVNFRLSPVNLKAGILAGEIRIANGKLGPGKVAGLVDLPIALSLAHQQKDAVITFSMEKGDFLPKFNLDNQDLRLSLQGKVLATPYPAMSPLDLEISFGFTEKVKSQLPAFLFDVILKPGENPDQTYSYKLTGNLRRPLFRPLKS